MGKTVVILVLSIAFFNASAQYAADNIIMNKTFAGYQFFQNGQQLNIRQLVSAMETNGQAYQEMKSAQANNTWATILGGAGGFMIGLPLGTLIAGGEPNLTFIGIGAGLLGASIPFTHSFNKRAKNAVNIYNTNKNATSYRRFNPEFELGITSNGTGILIKF